MDFARVWMLYGFLTFVVFLLQGGIMVWGGYLCWLAMQSTSCAAVRVPKASFTSMRRA